jgi:putative ABC transport system permease protein
VLLNVSKYVWKTVARHRMRSTLTVGGIATAMFLFVFIEGLQTGVRQATESSATGNKLIVYQKNRFCPAASSLPERYAAEIAKVPGVTSVLPVKLYVNNCRAALDSVTFRGVPPERITGGDQSIHLIAGSIDAFTQRRDAAIIGRRLAERRSLAPGKQFQVGAVSVQVAGIFESDVPGEDNLAYTQLEFLQRARGNETLGRVTQFDVTVGDASRLDAIAAGIDDIFRTDEVQTSTKSHKAFVSAATGDLLNIVRFTRYLGFVCILVVLGLTANTVYVLVQDRVKEHAVLQTIGFRGSHLFSMVIGESLLLSLLGGFIGTAAAAAMLWYGNLGMGAEGVEVSFVLAPGVVIIGLVASMLTGILAGTVPAIQAATAPIVDSLRRV